jgi:Nuclease-related domain
MEGGAATRGRRAGQHARAQAHDLATRMLVTSLAALAVLAVAWLVVGVSGWGLVGVEAVVIGALALADRAVEPRFEAWSQGARGEESVGAVLDGLVGEGWLAIHDVSLGRGNVDHVVVGPGGIFTVETKANRGRIRVDRIESRMLKQAYAEKKLIERVTGMKVEALLVFSEAWLVGKVPSRRDGVIVLPARMLAWYLSRRKPVMSVEEARGVVERLANAVV